LQVKTIGLCTLIAITIPLDVNVDMFRKQDTRDALGIDTLRDDVSPGF
jgi:hypothetical protein